MHSKVVRHGPKPGCIAGKHTARSTQVFGHGGLSICTMMQTVDKAHPVQASRFGVEAKVKVLNPLPDWSSRRAERETGMLVPLLLYGPSSHNPCYKPLSRWNDVQSFPRVLQNAFCYPPRIVSTVSRGLSPHL